MRPGTGSMRALGAALLALACSACADERPNVVLVVVDTLRADHTSLHGYERPTTPRIARWAEGGVVFERAWSACSWTTPSMNMLLTGDVRIENSGTILPAQRTLAEAASAAGYRTFAVVDNPLLTRAEAGAARGAGRGAGGGAGRGAGLGFDRGFEGYVLREGPRSAEERDGWGGEAVVQRGLEWIEAADDGRPFLLWLHLFDPHFPYDPDGGMRFLPADEPARRARLEDALLPEDAGALDDRAYAEVERQLALYDSEVLAVDRALGRMFDRLEELGLEGSTIVVLTSDHGEGLWERPHGVGEEPKPENVFPPLYYEHGTQLYSEQVHVPLVLRGPGVPEGVRVARDVSLLDVAPTLLSLLDLPGGAGAGLPLIAGGQVAQPPEDRDVYSLCSRGTTVTRGGRWRLHVPRAYRVEKHGAAPELYDLEADPDERTPVGDAARAAELAELVERFREHHLAADRARLEPSAEQEELMRDIGYGGEALLDGDER
jgi:arylsulfatase A-like enzyme